jgi:hypothetical protein
MVRHSWRTLHLDNAADGYDGILSVLKSISVVILVIVAIVICFILNCAIERRREERRRHRYHVSDSKISSEAKVFLGTGSTKGRASG